MMRKRATNYHDHDDAQDDAVHYSCAIIVSGGAVDHLDTHAIAMKTSDRAKFNRAGHTMMSVYAELFPHFHQMSKSFAMIDPTDFTRGHRLWPRVYAS